MSQLLLLQVLLKLALGHLLKLVGTLSWSNSEITTILYAVSTLDSSQILVLALAVRNMWVNFWLQYNSERLLIRTTEMPGPNSTTGQIREIHICPITGEQLRYIIKNSYSQKLTGVGSEFVFGYAWLGLGIEVQNLKWVSICEWVDNCVLRDDRICWQPKKTRY